jgi:hypothetical protein
LALVFHISIFTLKAFVVFPYLWHPSRRRKGWQGKKNIVGRQNQVEKEDEEEGEARAIRF